jgi:hypothetical protein
MHGGRTTSCNIGVNNVSNGDANVFEMVDMSSNGTGMYIEGGSTTQIRNCWFENQTVGLGQEVGLWVYGSFRNSTIDHCVFGSNTIDLYGGNGGAGAFHYDNTISNCWFQGTEGVSVDCDMWGRLTLLNNDYDGTVAWGANSTFQGALFTQSTDSAAVADQVHLGAYDVGAGDRVLAISQESAVAVDVDETKFSHKMKVRINGATYYIMLTQT